MSLIDSAPPAAPLSLAEGVAALFTKRDDDKVPCALTVAGSSKLALKLFDVTATGTVKPAAAGTLTLTLYGMAKGDVDESAGDPSAWLPLASCPPEPIGGPNDPAETMWMIQGADFMLFPGSGKLQGTFKSNVASNPQAAIDIAQHPGDVTETDPLYIFAVGASFTTSVARAAEGEAPACELTLVSFTMTGD